MPKKVAVKKPAAKKPEKKAKPEPALPKQAYVYFVESYVGGYGYRRTKKTEMRVATDIAKVPPGKLVGIYKLTGTGRVEKKVNVSLAASDREGEVTE